MATSKEEPDRSGAVPAVDELLVERDRSETLPPTEVFDILSNDRRVYLIRFLQVSPDPPHSLDTVVNQITAWENDKPAAEITGTERHRVYTSLRQVHLPSLDRANVVQFDKQRGTIGLDTAFDRVSAHLVYALRSAPSAETGMPMPADSAPAPISTPTPAPAPDSPAHGTDTADQSADLTRPWLLLGGVVVLTGSALGVGMSDDVLATLGLSIQPGTVLVVSVASVCLATAAVLFVSWIDS